MLFVFKQAFYLSNRTSISHFTVPYISDRSLHTLPKIIVLLHPHRSGWPEAWDTDANEYDNIKSAMNLRLDYVMRHGYAKMRCLAIPGCSDEIQVLRKAPD